MRARIAADRIQTLPVGENYDAPFRTERRRSGDQVRWRSWRGRRDPRIVVAMGIDLIFVFAYLMFDGIQTRIVFGRTEIATGRYPKGSPSISTITRSFD